MAGVQPITLSPKKIITHVNQRPCASLFADIADENFALLDQAFYSGGGALAERDYVLLANPRHANQECSVT